MIDEKLLWDLLREECCSTGKEAKCIVLLREEHIKKVIKEYNLKIKSTK